MGLAFRGRPSSNLILEAKKLITGFFLLDYVTFFLFSLTNLILDNVVNVRSPLREHKVSLNLDQRHCEQWGSCIKSAGGHSELESFDQGRQRPIEIRISCVIRSVKFPSSGGSACLPPGPFLHRHHPLAEVELCNSLLIRVMNVGVLGRTDEFKDVRWGHEGLSS